MTHLIPLRRVGRHSGWHGAYLAWGLHPLLPSWWLQHVHQAPKLVLTGNWGPHGWVASLDPLTTA